MYAIRSYYGIVLAEGLLQGLIGSIIGLLLGYLLAVGVINVAQGPISMFINLKLGTPVFSPALVVITSYSIHYTKLYDNANITNWTNDANDLYKNVLRRFSVFICG